MFVDNFTREDFSNFTIPRRIFTKSAKKIDEGMVELELFSEDLENINIVATDFGFLPKNSNNISDTYYSKCLVEDWRNFLYAKFGEKYKKEYAAYLLEGVNEKLDQLGKKHEKEKGV